MRLTLAAVLGGLLGWERELHGNAAGVRTHMLVSMGSAMFVMIAVQTGAQVNEASRVLQGVIAGVCFLGAGTILKEQITPNGPSQIRGLTTAAGIWLTAAIGVAAGLGQEATALLSALIAFAILRVVPLRIRHVDTHKEVADETNNHPHRCKFGMIQFQQIMRNPSKGFKKSFPHQFTR